MPFTVTMPKLSPTMEEGTIAKWHKKVGDKVESGELLVEVATDKATVEYNALDEGFLRKILVAEGGGAVVNQPIAIFTEKANESIEGYQPEGVQPSAPKPKAEAAAAPAPKAAAAAAPVGGAMQQPAFIPEPPLEKYAFEFPSGGEKGKASPLAKKMAREKGLDLGTVKGSGPGGRVTSRDLDLAQPDQPVSFGRRETPTIAPGTFEEIPLTPMRKVVGQRLQQSKTFIPHFYIGQDIDAEALFNLREQLKVANLKVTYNDFVVRACALALREHPHVNSGFNSVNQSIVLFKTIDISIAVTIDGGLITPIVRHADFKDLGEISSEVKSLAAKAKAGKLQPEEYKGGSFTISNMGMFGVSEFIAVINPPQAAILAVAGIEDCARVKNGQVVPGKKMTITLSADHRVIDGSDGAKFMKTVQKYLENPALLIV
ncbi:MAG: pyruvate dehydrogenase complex dihydrolipoamide acetyltransferase [Verrucomicrobia bacterium]|nr:pyruvate dehydrogenase complex dihydrolipoamide acetyltransferase [Verrucomicrobiota bacterium]